MKTAREAAARLGPIGLWSFELERMTAADEGRLAQEIESLGFRALWIPESLGSKEIFAHASILLAATKTLIVASGIANIWARDPVPSGARRRAGSRSSVTTRCSSPITWGGSSRRCPR